ncbi:hypothetical protein L1887_20168 [Cichorium endivia]|nr:hypothetical protein L1887_20168 [Cichorium endivia]
MCNGVLLEIDLPTCMPKINGRYFISFGVWGARMSVSVGKRYVLVVQHILLEVGTPPINAEGGEAKRYERLRLSSILYT